MTFIRTLTTCALLVSSASLFCMEAQLSVAQIQEQKISAFIIAIDQREDITVEGLPLDQQFTINRGLLRASETFTPLAYAIKAKRKDVINQLLEAGADIRAHDYLALTTPYAYADIKLVAELLVQVHGGSALKALDEVVHHKKLSHLFAEVKQLARVECQGLLLLPAARFNNAAMVEKLAQEGVSPNCQESDNERFSPLMYTVVHDNIKLAQYILEHPLMKNQKMELFNCKNSKEQTALIIAAARGNREFIKLFLDHHASDNIIDEEGLSAFMHALKHEGLVEFMLKHPHFVHSLKVLMGDCNYDRAGERTLLMVAAEKGCLPLVKLCVENTPGADMRKDRDGLTAFHWAAQAGHVEVLKYLFEKADAREKRTLMSTITNKGQTALILACMQGHQAVVAFLLANNDDATISDQNGWTALMYAAQGKHAAVITTIVQCSAKAIDSWGYPIHRANDAPEYVNRRNGFGGGDTALTIACEQGSVACAAALLDANADPLILGKNGLTPLMQAAVTNNLELANLLLGHKNVRNYKELLNKTTYYSNKPDYSTTTALILAAQRGHLDLVKLFVEFGADTSICNGAGLTALAAARLKGKQSVVEFFNSQQGSFFPSPFSIWS